MATLVQRGLADLPFATEDAISAIRTQFDQAVAFSAEASIALYSLGSAEILDRATAEIIDRMREWQILGNDCRVLDIGCGIGRIERALAPHVGSIVGIDVSPGMIAEARRRRGDVVNVTFEVCNGRDLAGFAAASFDVILAFDSSPYLVAAGAPVVDQHIADAHRILRAGGTLLILNFSYRGNSAEDIIDMMRLASNNGLAILRAGTRDFSVWDGVTYLLTKPLDKFTCC